MYKGIMSAIFGYFHLSYFCSETRYFNY